MSDKTGINRRGYAILKSPALSVGLVKAAALGGRDKRLDGVWEWKLFSKVNGWSTKDACRLACAQEVRRFVTSLTSRIRALIPGERFELSIVALRLTRNQIPESSHLHVDDGYVSAVHTFAGPGTVLYERLRARVARKRVRAGLTVVLTGARREAATGVLGTVHSAPPGRVGERIALVAYFSPKGQCPHAQRRIIEAREAFFAAHFSAQRKL